MENEQREEREQKRGGGLFLGVVAVATLIVAIIGATFAYFTATAGSNNASVNLTAYEFSASVEVEPVYPTIDGSLVPINPTATVAGTEPAITNLAYALNNATNKCIDSRGFQVCALYQVTITNEGAEALTFAGSVLTTVNNPASSEEGTTSTAFSNLKIAEVTGTTDNFAVGTSADIPAQVGDSIAFGTNITVPAKEGDTPGTAQKYFVVYLNDNEDQSSEMGAHFEGQLVFASTSGAEGRITGTFNIGG